MAVFGVGFDGIDPSALADRGILLANTPDVLSDDVAATAVLLWLACCRRLLPADEHARRGRWAARNRFPLTRSPLDSRVGILGFGRIGEVAARLLAPFRAEIHYQSRHRKDVPYRYHDSPASLAAAVGALIVITPGGPGTHHLVDATVIGALGPDGILVNVARGSVVDQAALIEALRTGELKMAGLDVIDGEPVVPEELCAITDRTVMSPHFASTTTETIAAMGYPVVRNLLAWAADEPVEPPVPESRRLLDRTR